jgi:hypothetical protein
MPARVIGCVVAVLCASLGLTACGSDSLSAGETLATSSLSKPQFIKKANALCTQREQKVVQQAAAYQASHPKASSQEVIEAVLVPGLRTQIAEVRKLGAPAGDEQQVEAILVAKSEALDRIEAEHLPQGQFHQVFTKSRNLSHAYGLQIC